MNTKHTFWSLCNDYDKIEIPIIQRDYAQGRDTPDVNKIRDEFINDYLIDSIVKEKQIELDFVYGSVLVPSKDNINTTEAFIPLDGQQRLTTLFLLHYYLAVKDKRIDEVKDVLLKFTYETRPTSYDFIRRLINDFRPKELKDIKSEILNAYWFDFEWLNDPTVSGMITMLDTFSENKELNSYSGNLFDKLINTENPLVSFYFIPLEKFGLTENLYIRMNARGKMLTNFENFKSKFFKIIAPFPELVEEIKDKIEYSWVENLWEYREMDTFTIDKPFMGYLSYITEMIYMKNAKYRADEYEKEFLNFKVLEEIYSRKENVEFLIFALDIIREIKELNDVDFLWEEDSAVRDILKGVVKGERDNLKYLLLFSVLLYLKSEADKDNINDFIRVVRNLVENTADNSLREWPRLISSIENLIESRNVYEILLENKDKSLLEGFRVSQREEEHFKALLIKKFPDKKATLFKYEDNELLKGNIKMLIATNFKESEKDLEEFKFNNIDVNEFDFALADKIYETYKLISKDDFVEVWGDLLISSVYHHDGYRLIYDKKNYENHQAVFSFALSFMNSKKAELQSFLVDRRKSFVLEMLDRYEDLKNTRDVKSQLYLYFIISMNLHDMGYTDFFKNGHNFGWLNKQSGYRSFFKSGIENDYYFEKKNPIFQTYNSDFRYNSGLKGYNALEVEIVENRISRKKTFRQLIEWAES